MGIARMFRSLLTPRMGPARRGADRDLLPFSTHRIQLPDGTWTAEAGVNVETDVRTRIVEDVCGGSLLETTVVDLGCLEGGFSAAFAKKGARLVVGIEAREVSYRRCQLLRKRLGLATLQFIHGDVKEVLERYPEAFDVVFAAGILYHVGDPLALLRSMRSVCRGFALVDTHVAGETASHNCSEPVERVFDGGTYRGRHFFEFDPSSPAPAREEMLWTAWSDPTSFWPFEEDLVRMCRDAGFRRVVDVDPRRNGIAANWGVDPTNRVLYVCHV